jgi:rhomboid protease GluP
MRAGASVHIFIANGEWWRVVSSIFVHVGGLHLLVNVIGLWFLGRLCEDLFGTPRTIAIFALSGIAGAVATYVVAPDNVTAGASAALFGVLGAVFVELTLYRQKHRTAWRRGMWSRLALVTVALIAVNFMNASVVQWGHGAGLVAGSVLGFALSPNVPWARASRLISIAITGSFGALCIATAIFVARTPLLASLGTPTHEVVIGGVALRAPAGWTAGAQLHGPAVIGRFAVDASPAALANWTKTETESAHHDFDQVDVATEKLVALPPGWQGSELVVSAEDPDSDGGRQTWRVIVAGKPLADGRVALTGIDIPEGMARTAASVFTELLATASVH